MLPIPPKPSLLPACLVLIVLVCLPVAGQAEVFELNPSQSMVITGKGPGQDGAINPYSGQDSYALVENLSDNPFQVRIQYKGDIVEIREINGRETSRFLLLSGQELYLDTELEARARVSFEEYRE